MISHANAKVIENIDIAGKRIGVTKGLLGIFVKYLFSAIRINGRKC